MDKYDEMISALEKQQKELEETKQQLRKAKAFSKVITPKCANCHHFCWHYVQDTFTIPGKVTFTRIDHGHCVYPRHKNRHAEQVCQYFEPSTKDKPVDGIAYVCSGAYRIR